MSPSSLIHAQRLADPAPNNDPFAAAVRATGLPMVVTHCVQDDCRIVFANDAYLALTGYDRDELVGRNPRMLQGPGTDPRTVDTMRAALCEGRELGVEVLNYRKTREPFWNAMFMSPVRAGNGAASHWFGSSLDITERKRAELDLVSAHCQLEHAVRSKTESLQASVEQKTVLLHEVEHRVKNNLQLISSLIQFQARRTGDPAVRDALREVQERVSAISTVHRRLFQTEDAGRFDVGQFLQDLVDDILGRAGRKDVEHRLELEPATAEAARAAPIALLVSEILAHALRIGFPPPRRGRITVRLRNLGEGFRIEVSDDGAASVDDLRDGLAGPSGIVHILRRQLGAKIEWRDNQPGVAALITLPMERDA